jgi:nitrous oxidase accessory protein
MHAPPLIVLTALMLAQTGAAHAQHAHAVRPAAAAMEVPAAPRTPLGERIAASAAGDTIRLAAGEHRGPIVIDRAVTILGQDGTVIDGGGAGTVVTMTGDGSALVGLSVRNGGRSLDRDDAGVRLMGCDGCTVREVHVAQVLHGIYLLASNGVTIEGNDVVGDAALEEARRGNGIHLFNSEGTRILRNTIRGTRDGIYFSFSSRSEVEDNDVTGVRYGLHYMYSDDNRFTGNRFTRNAAGAAIMFSKRILFEENLFSEHTGYRAYGILLQTSDDIEARRNRIEGNLVGVFLDNSARNVFRENAIVGNGTGIEFIPSAEHNTFAGNAIADNRTSVRVAVAGGTNRFVEDGRGNYWGSGKVFDLDGDGIGDRPHRAGDPFAALAAKRPVLETFANTPAARALSWAERAFPVFDLPDVEDPFPLVAPPPGVPLTEPQKAPWRPFSTAALLLLAPAAAFAARSVHLRRVAA